MTSKNLFGQSIATLKSHKGRVLNVVLALASIALAHYAGFVMELPLQIVAAAGGAMAPGVTATFLFYVALCAVIARVITLGIQLVMLPAILILDRAEHGRRLVTHGKRRKYVRTYHRLLRNESYLWLFFQGFVFIGMMNAIYVGFTFTWLSAVLLVLAMVALVLAGLFRSRFLLLCDRMRFLDRFKRREAFRVNVASALFVTLASALVALSFSLGAMRMTLLKNDRPQQVANRYFTGYAKLLASSGSSTLLFEQGAEASRYIYATPEHGLAIESKTKAFALLARP